MEDIHSFRAEAGLRGHLWLTGESLAVIILSVYALGQSQQPRPLEAVSPRKGGSAQAAGQVTQSPPEKQSSIMISCESPVDLMLSDPAGRRLGADPTARMEYQEIPAAYYESVGLEDDETGAAEDDPAKSMFIPNPITGSYHLYIAGIAAGVYSCYISAEDGNGTDKEARLEKISIREGEVHSYVFEFKDKAGSELDLHRQ